MGFDALLDKVAELEAAEAENRAFVWKTVDGMSDGSSYSYEVRREEYYAYVEGWLETPLKDGEYIHACDPGKEYSWYSHIVKGDTVGIYGFAGN